MYMSFINNLGFITSNHSISKVRKITLEQEASNLVTYDMSKTKVIYFFKAYKTTIRNLIEVWWQNYYFQ